tara:strand:+ start:1395 stop:1715 length:321 start_codon:yes stop_codon:yes gene_type:complete
MAFNIKQNDTSPSLQATLKDAQLVPVDITAATVKLHMKSLDGVVKINETMTITDALNGVVQYDWQAGDTDTVGTYYVEFQVTYADASVETFPNNGNLVVSVVRELN